MKQDSDKIIDFNQYRNENDLDMDELEGFFELEDNDLEEFYSSFDEGKSERAIFEEIKELEICEQKDYLVWKASEPNGWRNLEERPYLRQKMELAMLCKQNGLYQKALNHFMQIYEVDESDALGCRYEILSLYVLKSDFSGTVSFYDSRAYHKDDVLMQVPLLIGAILEGLDLKAKVLIKELIKEVDGFVDFCQLQSFPLHLMMEAGELENYEPNTMECVYLGLYNIFPLMFTVHSYVFNYLNNFFTSDNNFLGNSGISKTKVSIFNKCDIYYLSDFSGWTEKELLSISGIGKEIVKKLKELGAVFNK